MSRNTGFAEAAMFAACWFGETAGATEVAGMEENAVIGIPLHLCLVVVWRDEGLGHDTLVEQDIRQDYQSWYPVLMNARHSGPSWGKKNRFADCKQAHEEDLAGMLDKRCLEDGCPCADQD